ncbi:hypothetical protein QBC47DRAFT_178335 [Echria macrotheca]|uniref:Uncharacterized protein n=1 Tax=Echria macrotheca TaxID=438768 RepID=A0AAJ0BHM0_9PEZI|nr:hypothetical protein QBC47DRAFT_178335 [Echria macrotheca]
MAIPRLLPAGLGALTLLPTTAILVIHIILAHSLADTIPNSSTRITAIIAAILEVSVLVALAGLVGSHLWTWPWLARIKSINGVCFGVGLFLCAVAAAVSVSSLVCLSNATSELPSTILGSRITNFLVGASVTLGLAFATQLVFLVFHFVVGRFQGVSNGRSSVDTTEEGNQSAEHREVKSIGYHQTNPYGTNIPRNTSLDSRYPPGSSDVRSASETMSSFRSSLSSVVRPISSKTRLLPASQRSPRRPISVDTEKLHDHRQSPAEDGFDSWDTSAVDPQNRQTVLQSSPPPLGRFLETIPASPITSRSPSPANALDLEPPRTRRRSRSYSPGPAGSGTASRPLTQQSTHSESHIHPLFRSDSPTPPPTATPGTIVVAAPNGGQILSDRASIRTLTRMRSGSLPAVPSPLSRQGSFDSFPRRPDSSSPELPEESEDELQVAGEGTERKMTPPIPPIPDWILSAGSRMSLSGYNNRKIRSSHGDETRTRGGPL